MSRGGPFADLSRREWRALGRDVRALRAFYLSADRQARLARMGSLRRAIWTVIWTVQSVLLRLTPARRVLAALALAGAYLGHVVIPVGTLRIPTDLRFWAFVTILVILMLELKDKLVARDEIAVARDVQLALLPRREPRLPGWEIWGRTRPANDVGGDLIDFLPLDGGRLGVAVGDIAGKGLGAALLMAKLQATLRALVPESQDLPHLGTRLNRTLCRDGLDNRFATLLYAEIDPGSGAVSYLNAGHNTPLVLRAERIESPEPANMPLGLFAEAAFVAGSVDLEPGDMLVLYTDGLTEARDGGGAFFGEDRLRGLARTQCGANAESTGRTLLDALDRFLGTVRPDDDQTLVILRRTSEPARPEQA